MKNFFKSVSGKVILFIAFTLCLSLSVAGFAGIFAMIDMNVYNTDETKVMEQTRDSYIYNRAYSFAWRNLTEHTTSSDSYNSSVEIIIRDADGEIVAYTEDAIECSENEKYQKEIEYNIYMTTDEYGNMDMYHGDPQTPEQDVQTYTVEAYVNPELPLSPTSEIENYFIHLLFSLKYSIYPILVLVLLMCVLIFVELMSVAGYRPDTEGFYQGAFFKVPYDLILAIAAAAVYLATMLVSSIDDDMLMIIAIIIYMISVTNIVLGLSMSFASRVKQKALIRNTLIYRMICLSLKLIKLIVIALIKAVKRVFKFTLNTVRCIPMVWRTLLIIAAVCFVELIFLSMDAYPVLWIMEKIITIPLVLLAVIIMRKLQQAGVAIADGDLEYKVDTKYMFWDFKKHAENLNSISRGMSQAVEQRLKSERMKTELITNVSHDIKTPLTSIINYAGLISNEQTDNPNISQYSEVLLRQSEKLKRLIDDLVEASKASTGNLEVAPIPCDASVFITQTSGEYEEKLNKAGLTLVTSLPERKTDIMADSRRMWRVFDNLMNNACKYSQYGTRVYLSLEAVDNKAVITFKNTSREILNISSEELMERFVRGDSSRNTDGNGLGLSIARSLTELQGGEFDISIDGDLFKAILKFPII